MSTDNRARVVNGAFLTELKECNSALWEDVNMLGSYSQEPFCGDWIEQNGGALLRRLRDRLSGQYRLEETFGFVAGIHNHQDPRVTKALDQHLSLVLECVALSERCDDLEYCGKLSRETFDIWKQMKHLYDGIIEHESLERNLVLSALSPDLLETQHQLDSVKQ
jgi:hypothetical protein